MPKAIPYSEVTHWPSFELFVKFFRDLRQGRCTVFFSAALKDCISSVLVPIYTKTLLQIDNDKICAIDQ